MTTGQQRDSTPRQLAERLAYSVDEVAQITGLSRDLLYDQMRTGQLAYIKVGRRRIITRQHLEAFLTARPGTESGNQPGAAR
jgi:excisionase family DNA binding protein